MCWAKAGCLSAGPVEQVERRDVVGIADRSLAFVRSVAGIDFRRSVVAVVGAPNGKWRDDAVFVRNTHVAPIIVTSE